MPRIIIKIIGIFGILTLVGCQNNAQTGREKFKSIMIKSYGEIETLPDMATFHIDLQCLDKSIKASKECLVEKSSNLKTQLLSFGIHEEDILTTSVNLNKSYTWRNNSNVFEGYRSSTTAFVTVRSIENLDEIYTDLLENSHLNLSGLNYSHSKIDSLKNEAYLNALEKSNVLSDRLLEKLPESNKEILKIGNVEISASMPESNDFAQDARYDMEESVESQSKSIAISKGTVKVTATLYVEYQIESE